MAKNTNQRAKRMEKNNRNVNRAVWLLMVAFIAEFYLLLINTFFVRGTTKQLLFCNTVLNVMLYAGVAALCAGLVLLVMKKNDAKLAALRNWLLGCGVFFAFSSKLMTAVYPRGTTAMCILVPAAAVLGIVFLMYPREFSAEAVALSASILAMILLNRGAASVTWQTLIKVYSVLALCLIAAMFVAAMLAKKNGGKLKTLHVFPNGTNYTILYAVFAVCLAALVVALFVAGVAYYGIWALSIALFVLAVYYTVKLM